MPDRSPATKLKHLNWSRLPDAKLLQSPNNVWASLLDAAGPSVNYDELETLFAAAVAPSSSSLTDIRKAAPKVPAHTALRHRHHPYSSGGLSS